ncbi:MAG: hypothetical protein AAGI46_00995 [Planctomycetota bacterium]
MSAAVFPPEHDLAAELERDATSGREQVAFGVGEAVMPEGRPASRRGLSQSDENKAGDGAVQSGAFAQFHESRSADNRFI